VIRERLEVHLLVAADRNDTPERRQRFGAEQLPCAHLRPPARVVGHERG